MVKIKIMKKILLILLVSVLLIGCSNNEPQNTELKKIFTKRVLIDELTNKGTKYSQLMYYESGLFNGIGFDVFTDGSLKEGGNYKDGEKDGLREDWYSNGQIKYEWNYKDGVGKRID